MADEVKGTITKVKVNEDIYDVGGSGGSGGGGGDLTKWKWRDFDIQTPPADSLGKIDTTRIPYKYGDGSSYDVEFSKNGDGWKWDITNIAFTNELVDGNFPIDIYFNQLDDNTLEESYSKRLAVWSKIYYAKFYLDQEDTMLDSKLTLYAYGDIPADQAFRITMRYYTK